HVRAVPPFLRSAPLRQRRGSALRRRRRSPQYRTTDDRGRRDAPCGGDRPRHRVLPQCAVVRLQDRRRHRASPPRAASPTGARARRPRRPGIGRVTAARLIARYGAIEDCPATVLGERRELALLFKTLATLRTDAELFEDVDELRWRGPTAAFPACAARLGDERLLGRSRKAPVSRAPPRLVP